MSELNPFSISAQTLAALRCLPYSSSKCWNILPVLSSLDRLFLCSEINKMYGEKQNTKKDQLMAATQIAIKFAGKIPRASIARLLRLKISFISGVEVIGVVSSDLSKYISFIILK